MIAYEQLQVFEIKEDESRKRINSAAFGELQSWFLMTDQNSLASFIDRLFTWNSETEWRYWETKDGKWTKRFAKAYYEYGRGKISSDLLAQIGERISRHINPETTVYFSFSKKDWMHGSFELSKYSPDGSRPGPCWWTTHNASRIGFLKDVNGFAVKLYKDANQFESDNNTGIGRCWGYKVNETDFVIFNAYGPLRLEKIAAMLSEVLNLKSKRIKVKSPVDESGDKLMFINEGEYNNDGRGGGVTGVGYYIGKDADAIDSFLLPDVRVKDAVCPSCNQACFSKSLRGIMMRGGRRKTYCNQCSSTVFICSVCDYGENREHLHVVNGSNCCTICYDKLDTCSTHGKVMSRAPQIWHTQRTFCSMCVNEGIVKQCRGCGKTKDANKVKNIRLPQLRMDLCYSCSGKVGEHA